MQIRRIWEFLGIRMTRTLQHSKQRKGRPQPANFKAGQHHNVAANCPGTDVKLMRKIAGSLLPPEAQSLQMILLVFLPLARFHLVQLLANGLVLLILRPHFLPFIQGGKAAFGLDTFTAQIIIGVIHGRDFFIKLLHRSNTAALQKHQQFVICGNLAVDVSFLCLDALALHLSGGNAYVDWGPEDRL